jgi:hypothetical protein
MIEYKFGNVQEYDIPSPSLSPVIEDSPSPQNALPDYIPSYFPPFPEIKEDTVMDEVDRILLKKQQQLEEQKLQQLQQQQKQQQQQASSLPLPVIVKNRKKPIENPFTHIIPFEESSLASEQDQQQQQSAQPKPLSFLLKVGNKRREVDEQESARKRRKAAITPLTEALKSMKEKPGYRLGEGLAGRDELFKTQTQNAATPGNYLFNHDSGVFDELVRNVAEPLVISKLTAPNLLIDIHTTTSNTPAPVTPALFEYGSPGSMPTSPDGSKLSRSASMLAVLAGGASSKKAGLKQLNKLAKTKSISASSFNANHTISKHSVDINAIKTGDSKYIIKKKRMLAEQQQALERQKLLEQQLKDNPNGESSSITSIPTAVSSTSTNSLPALSQPQSLQHQQLQPQQNATISHNNLSVAISTSSSIPAKPMMQNTGPISLSSFSSNTAAAAAAAAVRSGEKEKKQKQKKTPKLMLNFFQTPLPSPAEDSPSTPKIRFKIKPPEQSPKKVKQQPQNESIAPIKLEKQQQFQPTPIPQQPITIQQQPSMPKNFSSSMNNGFTPSEEIRCICENPTVDYGTFMIACDRCSVWFHGSCVGIAESDQVEEWYCRRCRAR